MLALSLTMCCQPVQTPELGYEMASAESVQVICTDDITRDKVRQILTDALDRALENHVVHMFEIWMKDSREQPERAATGIRNGVVAYINARKKALEWSPMACPG